MTQGIFPGRDQLVRGNIFDLTVSRLRELIDTSGLRAGDKLPSERELGELLCVSRSILREALRVVEAQGLITIIQGKGAYVRKPGLHTVIEPVQRLIKDGTVTLENLMQARAILEPHVARLASLNIQAAQIEKLEHDYAEMVKYLNFPDKYLEADKVFHTRLAEATGNPALVIMMWPLINLFAGFAPLFYLRPGTPQKVSPAHEEILRALKEHDPDKAEQAMRDHLQEVREWFAQFGGERIFDQKE